MFSFVLPLNTLAIALSICVGKNFKNKKQKPPKIETRTSITTNETGTVGNSQAS